MNDHDFSEAGLPKENSCCLLATIKAVVSSTHVTDEHTGLWALDVLLFPGSKCTLKHKAVQSNVYLPNEELTNDVEKLVLLRELSSPILIQNTVFIYAESADRMTAPTCSRPMTATGCRRHGSVNSHCDVSSCVSPLPVSPPHPRLLVHIGNRNPDH